MSRDLIFSILHSLPSRREAISFLKKNNFNLNWIEGPSGAGGAGQSKASSLLLPASNNHDTAAANAERAGGIALILIKRELFLPIHNSHHHAHPHHQPDHQDKKRKYLQAMAHNLSQIALLGLRPIVVLEGDDDAGNSSSYESTSLARFNDNDQNSVLLNLKKKGKRKLEGRKEEREMEGELKVSSHHHHHHQQQQQIKRRKDLINWAFELAEMVDLSHNNNSSPSGSEGVFERGEEPSSAFSSLSMKASGGRRNSVRATPIYNDFITFVKEGSGQASKKDPHEKEFVKIPKLNEEGTGEEEGGLPSGIHRINLNLENLSIPLSRGEIPIIVPLAIHPESCLISNIPTSQLLLNLCYSLSTAAASNLNLYPPMKFIVLNKFGGVQSSFGHVSFINLDSNYKKTWCSGEVSSHFPSLVNEDIRKSEINSINQIHDVLSLLPSTSSAILSSCTEKEMAVGVIANLLTEKVPSSLSSGTLRGGNIISQNNNPSVTPIPQTMFRKGLTLKTYTSLHDTSLNLPSLTSLLEASFGRRLDDISYYQRLEKCVKSITIAGDFNGAVIVTYEGDEDLHRRERGKVYLDKFAVSPTSQGLGVADLLWSELLRQNETIFWRSRSVNPVNKWYFERADGHFRQEGDYWTLFWLGKGIGCGSREEEENSSRLKEFQRLSNLIPPSFLPTNSIGH